MLAIRTKDPALAELDRKIYKTLQEYKRLLTAADNDASCLSTAESVYEDMNALLDLRNRAKRARQNVGKGVIAAS